MILDEQCKQWHQQRLIGQWWISSLFAVFFMRFCGCNSTSTTTFEVNLIEIVEHKRYIIIFKLAYNEFFVRLRYLGDLLNQKKWQGMNEREKWCYFHLRIVQIFRWILFNDQWMHKQNFSVLATHTNTYARVILCSKIQRKKNLLNNTFSIQWIGQISREISFSLNEWKKTYCDPKITNEFRPMCEIELNKWFTVFVDFNRSNKDWWLNFLSIHHIVVDVFSSSIIHSFVRSLVH